MFDLKRAWNCNMKLKFAVRRAAAEGISKEEVVKFWRESARKLGFWGSYPIDKPKRNPLSADESPDWYKRWKGEIGEGLQLRQILADRKFN
ncbi:hypothetical protein [Vibrio fluvialis]|uniref:hypothetical protein n=1 Tax=Vibrio fluvialis TaxID=676 RepID=UPI003D0C4954